MKESHYKNWLRYIADIALDRDGWKNAKDLGELVDDIRAMALEALHGDECPLKQYKDAE